MDENKSIGVVKYMTVVLFTLIFAFWPVFNVTAEDRAGKDDRFSVDNDRIITVHVTNLQWYVGPDKATSLNEAKSWVESLSVGGGGCFVYHYLRYFSKSIFCGWLYFYPK